MPKNNQTQIKFLNFQLYKMELSNNNCELFFDELFKFQISHTIEDNEILAPDEDGLPISLLYNGFDKNSKVNLHYIVLLENVKKEIFNNLLLIGSTKSGEDYLKRLWFKCIKFDDIFSTIIELIGDSEIDLQRLKDFNVFIVEKVIVNIKLPQVDFVVLNMIVDGMFSISQCITYQYEIFEDFLNFIDELCQLQSIVLTVDTLSVDEYLRNVKKKNKNGDIEPETEIDETFIRWENAGQKYLLLEQLGIINFLNKKYSFKSAAQKALLMAYITDTKSNKSLENVLSQRNNLHSEHYPYKEGNINKVANIFEKCGLYKQNRITPIKIDSKK